MAPSLIIAAETCQKASTAGTVLGLAIILAFIGGIVALALANARARKQLAMANYELNYGTPGECQAPSVVSGRIGASGDSDRVWGREVRFRRNGIQTRPCGMKVDSGTGPAGPTMSPMQELPLRMLNGESDVGVSGQDGDGGEHGVVDEVGCDQSVQAVVLLERAGHEVAEWDREQEAQSVIDVVTGP